VALSEERPTIQYEKVRQNSVLGTGGGDLCDFVRSRSTKVQKEQQELPDE
jgi:hypothetical protein